MGWTRHTGAVVSLAVLASVVANYAVLRHFETRQHLSSASMERSRATPEALIFDYRLDSDADDFAPAPIPRFLDEMQHAVGVGPVTPALQTTEAVSDSVDAPKPVPAPNDGALPTDDQDSGDLRKAESQGTLAVRKVIEEELAGSSQEERDIWFEELKSIPAGVVRDLLQVRKQLRALPRALHKMDAVASSPVSAPRATELVAEPASQVRRQPLPDWVPTMGALEQACTIARHNLANSATPGFKRLRVTIVDNYGTQWKNGASAADGSGTEPTPPARLSPIQVEGCRLSDPLLDLKDGTLNKTGRPLDLAIDGSGFFPVMVNDELAYTRCGAMVLNAQRHICLAVADGLAELQPVITIPAETREIQIAADGTVMALVKPGEDPVTVGQLLLAEFASPSLLRPIGGTLLAPNDASGAAETAAPCEGSRGGIQQGFLEQSNVDSEAETAELERWQSLLKSFPTVGRPVTASGPEQQSR